MADGNQRYTSPAWRALRLAVLDRDKWVCQIRDRGCSHVASTVDHIEPIIGGGDMWDETNLRAACKPCNSRRGAIDKAKRSARYRTTVARTETRM